MAKKTTIQQDEETYRIVSMDGKASEVVVYGDPAVLEVAGTTYAAFLDSPNVPYEEFGDNPRIYRMSALPTTVEEVTFEAGDQPQTTENAEGDTEGDTEGGTNSDTEDNTAA